MGGNDDFTVDAAPAGQDLDVSTEPLDEVVLPAAGGVSRRTVAAAADRARSALAAHVATTRPVRAREEGR